ncbi:MAG: prepilin-type N-terminal cleavage/methylation domain-containing protein [Planctomycetes bacterium]|nr:prepilin-type N-terminal cleavage/methylation domain-containing protein [Planctomycetota bacterium]
MTRPGPQGFTLVELLVVLTIVGLLLALLLPGFGMVWKTAKVAQCSQNLYRISQAYGVRGADSRMDPDRVKPLRVGSWKTMLLPYLENDSGVLVCPEANMEVGQPEEEYDASNPGDGVGGGGWSGGSGGSSGSTDPVPMGSASTEDLKVEVWLRPGNPFRGVEQNNLIYVMDCEPGQWARRYSPGEQTVVGGQVVGHVVPSGCYELGFEDSWNTTWDDLYLRFVEKPDGSLEITYIEEHTGGNCYNLVNITTGEQLLVGMGDGNAARGWPKLAYGASVTIKPEEQTTETPPISDDRNPIFSPGGGTTGGGAGITAGTYGMNSLADKIEGLASHVVLCLDYKKTVARGPTSPMPDLWTNIGWQTSDGLPVFARHDGRVNVLWSDGSVELVLPSDIDPAGPSAVRRFWDPARGR